MSTQPAEERHLAAVPSDDQLAAAAAEEAKEEIRRQTKMVELIQQISHHESQRDGHTQAIQRLEAELRELHAQPGTTVKAGDFKVTWKNPSRSFQSEAFQQKFPQSTHPHLYTTKTVLDTTAIPPKLKERFMAPGSGNGSLIIK